MPDELAIDVRGMTKRFGSRTVVDHIDLQVRRGEIFGFLGPNGSGKTTFIRMLCGLLKADAGSGTCLGHDVITETDAVKRQVGYMTQKFSFYEDLSITENLDFVARMYAVPNRRQAVRESIERLGLTGREKQLAGQLSGGWKQRLALAACMIHEPQLLLLDEPTAGVDPKARRDFWEQIHMLAARGLTVLITTHYMDEAERCHRLAYIFNGKMLVKGTVGDVVAHAGLHTWTVGGPNLLSLAEKLRQRPGVQQTVAFGNELHVSGTDAAALAQAIAPFRTPEYRWREIGPGLEDVFIHLMETAQGGVAMKLHTFSIARFWAMVVKEFVQMRRDRLTFGMMIGVPLLQLVLFGFAINSDPRHMTAAVLVADNGPQGRTLLHAIRNSTYFDFVREVKSEAEARELIARGEVQFVVTIPENFSRDLLRGEKPAVLIEADATDPAATSNAIGSLRTIADSALKNDLKGPLSDLAPVDPPVEMRVHARYNPEAITQYNIVPGLMGVVLTMTMVMITALAITRERERGTMENLLSMPARPFEVLIGKIVPYIAVGYVQVGLILIAARYLFNVPMVGDIGLLLAVAFLFIVANLAMGITFSTLARNQLQAMQMSFFFFLPSILLSGFMFPFRGMPQWAQVIGEVLPLTHFLRVIRGILLKGNGFDDVAPELWPIAVFAAVAVTVGVARYRQTLD